MPYVFLMVFFLTKKQKDRHGGKQTLLAKLITNICWFPKTILPIISFSFTYRQIQSTALTRYRFYNSHASSCHHWRTNNIKEPPPHPPGIGFCKLIVLLITVCINWFMLQPRISLHNLRRSTSNHKHSIGCGRGPVAPVGARLAQWHIFSLTEMGSRLLHLSATVNLARAYTHVNRARTQTGTHVRPSNTVNCISRL